MVEGIINGVPIWVWPLFLVLLFFGIRASRQRQAPVVVSYLLPFLGLLSISAVSNLGTQSIWGALVWSVFAIAYVGGAMFGYARQARWLISKEDGRMVLAGEWTTLTTMMTIFLANFVAGTLNALSPAILDSAGFILVFVVFVAFSSGMFFGRGVRVFRS